MKKVLAAVLPWVIPPLFYFVIAYINDVVWLPFFEHTAFSLPPAPPLFDWGHYLLGDYSHLSHYADALPVLPIVSALVFAGPRSLWPNLMLLGLGYIIRGLCYAVTVLPTVLLVCQQAWAVHNDHPKLDFWGGCFDLIFSGHTLWIWFPIHHLVLRSQHRLAAFLLLYPYGFAATCVIVATRLHYSVDVLLSFVISLLLCLGCYDHVNVFKWFEPSPTPAGKKGQ